MHPLLLYFSAYWPFACPYLSCNKLSISYQFATSKTWSDERTDRCFFCIGGTTGSIITGHIFEAYGGQTAFYFSLVPISILFICLFIFNALQKKETQRQV
jgi:hypothetical protein